MGSLLNRGGGGVLDFNHDECGRDSTLSGSPGGGIGTVLAAAARIERGLPPQFPSP
jgi:hypothetical protein